MQHTKTDYRPPPSISTSPFGDPRFPGASTFTPRTGLDFLHGIPSIHVEQTISLLNGMKNIFINSIETIKVQCGTSDH